MGDVVRRRLCAMIARHGSNIVKSTTRCNALLKDVGAGYPTELAALQAVLGSGVVRDMLELPKSNTFVNELEDMTERVCAKRSIDPDAARWGLEAWALALDMIGPAQLTMDQIGQARWTLGQNILINTQSQLFVGIVLGVGRGTFLFMIGCLLTWAIAERWPAALLGFAFTFIRFSEPNRCLRLAAALCTAACFALGSWIFAFAEGVVWPLTGAVCAVLVWYFAALAMDLSQGVRMPPALIPFLVGASAGTLAWPLAAALASIADYFIPAAGWALVSALVGVIVGAIPSSENEGRSRLRQMATCAGEGLVVGALAGYFEGGILAWIVGGVMVSLLEIFTIYRPRKHHAAIQCVRFSRDAKHCLSTDLEASVVLWRIHQRGVHKTLQREHGVRCADFSPDGTKIICGDNAGRLTVTDLNDEKTCLRTDAHAGPVFAAAWLGDGYSVISSGADGAIRIWDTVTGVEELCLHGHGGAVCCLAVSHNGHRAVSGGVDGTVRLWHLLAGNELACFSLDGPIQAVAFSPDASCITAAHAGLINVWHIATRKVASAFSARTRVVHSLTFLPDGQRLVVAGCDGAVRLWDVAAGKEIGCLERQRRAVLSTAVSPDGRYVLSAGEDRTVQLARVESFVPATGRQARKRSADFS